MKDLQNGDLVRLKSGGPQMTILFFSTTYGIKCAWFVEGNELKEGFFTEESLIKVE